MTESDLQIIAVAAQRAAPTSPAVSVGPNEVRLLRDGGEAYPAMLAAIGAARKEIVMEMYWFGSDAVGRQFCDALAARARAGVTVRVVFDAFGSAPIDEEMFDELRASGADVRVFHPLVGLFRRATRWFLRNHRKLIVCDAEVGYTGGLNIGRPWASLEQGGEGWRDDMVEVRGPGAIELRILFYETWRRMLGRKERLDPRVMPADVPLLDPEPKGAVWAIANRRSRKARRAIRSTYLRWILGAERTIDIVNAYFVPDRFIRRALVRAVKRGVKVRVIVPEHGDVPFVQWAVEATMLRLVRGGVQAYAYRESVLHSKTACVDQYVTIGSYNLDIRSFRYNLEVNLAIHSEAFANQVRSAIDLDVARSTVWTEEALMKRSWFRRFLGEFALLFARFL